MRYLAIFILCLGTGIFRTQIAAAQVKARSEISGARQRDGDIALTITCPKPFINGNNRYILYTGHKEFGRYEISRKDGKGVITFLIPKDEFNHLAEGSPVYMTYGHVEAEETDMEALAASSHRCWSLGKFSRSVLKK